MKCLKIAILVVCILLTVSTSYPQSLLISGECDQSYSQVKVVDKAYKSKNNLLEVDVRIPEVKGLEDHKEENINNVVSKWTEQWIKDATSTTKDIFKNYPPPVAPYQLYARYKVTKLEPILSFYIDYYQYLGGAHGITTRKAYTIDYKSGNLFKIGDIFEVGYNYKEVIDNFIQKEIDKSPDMYFTGKEGFNGIDEKVKFYIEDDNLVVYYGHYEIAPYVAGIPEFHIPIEVFKENFKYGKL